MRVLWDHECKIQLKMLFSQGIHILRRLRSVHVPSLSCQHSKFYMNNTCTTSSILTELLTQPFRYDSPPPHLYCAQLHGSTHSPTKCPASSFLSLMTSPDFMVPESCNRLMKFRENWQSWDMAYPRHYAAQTHVRYGSGWGSLWAQET